MIVNPANRQAINKPDVILGPILPAHQVRDKRVRRVDLSHSVLDFNKFKSLNLKKQKAVILRADGVKFEAIAVELGVHIRTVMRWLGPDGTLMPAYRGYVEDLTRQREADSVEFQAKVVKDAQKAWLRLTELALGSTIDGQPIDVPASVSLSALDSILDRAGMGRQSKIDSKSEVKTINQEDVEKKLAKAAELVKGLRVVSP